MKRVKMSKHVVAEGGKAEPQTAPVTTKPSVPRAPHRQPSKDVSRAGRSLSRPIDNSESNDTPPSSIKCIDLSPETLCRKVLDKLEQIQIPDGKVDETQVDALRTALVKAVGPHIKFLLLVIPIACDQVGQLLVRDGEFLKKLCQLIFIHPLINQKVSLQRIAQRYQAKIQKNKETYLQFLQSTRRQSDSMPTFGQKPQTILSATAPSCHAETSNSNTVAQTQAVVVPSLSTSGQLPNLNDLLRERFRPEQPKNDLPTKVDPQQKASLISRPSALVNQEPKVGAAKSSNKRTSVSPSQRNAIPTKSQTPSQSNRQLSKGQDTSGRRRNPPIHFTELMKRLNMPKDAKSQKSPKPDRPAQLVEALYPSFDAAQPVLPSRENKIRKLIHQNDRYLIDFFEINDVYLLEDIHIVGILEQDYLGLGLFAVLYITRKLTQNQAEDTSLHVPSVLALTPLPRCHQVLSLDNQVLRKLEAAYNIDAYVLKDQYVTFQRYFELEI